MTIIEKMETKNELISMEPKSIDEAMKLAEYLSKSNIVPKDFQGKPENVFIAISMGHEIGLKAITALQSIMVVNGRPSIWGDALWALVKNSIGKEDGVVEYAKEWMDETDPKNPTAFCEIKMRRDKEPVIRSFSQADAVKSKLWSKAGPWQDYPKRMMQMRARAFASRDAAPDLLKGLAVIEEMRDVPEVPSEPVNEFMPECEVLDIPEVGANASN